eukprot:m.307306 g.307306  ORF g.307306 m.307306 type:complete len:694 (+) comp27380_c0_seq1:102-2183(+)
MPHALTPLALHVSTIIAVARVVVLAPTSGSAGEPDPVASSDAVVTAPGARFTVLTPSLLRLEHLTPPVVSTAGTQVGGDDRATTVVINRRLPVPAFSVTHPNATTTVITTAQLRLTYTAPGPLHLSEARPTRKHPGSDPRSDTTTDTCGCSATKTTTTCVSDGGPRDAVWTVHADTQGGDGHRTPSHPDGLANQTLSSCFCACMADPDCTAFTYAPPGQDLGRSCWLLAGVSKTMSVGDRVFAGVVSGGFTDATLQIEMLDRAAPVRVWRPSMGHGRNLNGSYPALDCYTVPAACAASNQRRMEPGLLSRDGWAVWNDIESPRMVRTPESVTVRYAAWHTANLMNVTDEDLYFWGHGLDFRGALKDFLQISGPPGLLSAADYGLWWSNSFVFTKDQFLNRLISNFTKHSLPFTHLVMDYGWHQQQDGKLWASYTWSETLFGDPAEVQAFVQSLHSTDPTSPLGRPLALSLNLHPVGVEPPELRYPEFERQIGADPTKNQTMPCSQSNETWMSALFDQVLDAPPNSGVDSWWTAGGPMGPATAGPTAETGTISTPTARGWPSIANSGGTSCRGGGAWARSGCRSGSPGTRPPHGPRCSSRCRALPRLPTSCLMRGPTTLAALTAVVANRAVESTASVRSRRGRAARPTRAPIQGLSCWCGGCSTVRSRPWTVCTAGAATVNSGPFRTLRRCETR